MVACRRRHHVWKERARESLLGTALYNGRSRPRHSTARPSRAQWLPVIVTLLLVMAVQTDGSCAPGTTGLDAGPCVQCEAGKFKDTAGFFFVHDLSLNSTRVCISVSTMN
jgi:hypothetical protein